MCLAVLRAVSIALSFETSEFPRFETDEDIDSDLPRVDEHGRITLRVRTLYVSSDRCDALLSDVILEERHSECELMENKRR